MAQVAAVLASEGEDLGSSMEWTPDWDVEAKQGGGGANNWRHKGTAIAKL